MHVFVDQISHLSLSNNNLRITLTQRAGDEKMVEIGTLIIPVNQVNNFVNRLTSGLTQLNEQIKAQTEKKADQ